MVGFHKRQANTGLLGITLSSVLLAACGGGGGGGGSAGAGGTDISGTPIKGPMVNADVSAFRFDASDDRLIGSLLASGTTNEQAAISGLRLPSDYSGVFILEVRANEQTRDLSTDLAPAITVFRTVLNTSNVQSNVPVYPSPLTSLAYELAVDNADSAAYGGNDDGSVSEDELTAAFALASQKVLATVGFGLELDTDLNATPALLTSATTTTDAKLKAIRYRAAIEALSAILITMKDDATANNVSSTQTTDSLLSALAADLGDDVIDGSAGGEPISAFADITDVVALVTVDPATLKVPGTETSIADIESVLVAEQGATGEDVDSADVANGSVSADPEPAKTASDIDGDGVADSTDNCPAISNPGQGDLDEDGAGDVCDGDRDGDGVANADDAFPNDATETVDTDSDGTGNNADTDDDGDGVADVDDAFPLDRLETTDTDLDGIGNNADPDDDDDGVADADDAFPLDENESVDSDGDGVGDNGDGDVDGDGVDNDIDNCPTVANEDQADSDSDDIGDVCDEDDPEPTLAVWDSFNWDDANWQ